jgi:UDP-N-acetylmuramate dehydrogenase
MTIQKNISLAQYTTFRIGGPARHFCEVTSEDELVEAVESAKSGQMRILVIGGGSNILISDSGFDGMVILMMIKGIEISGSLVAAGAGEDWEDLVEKIVSKGLYGAENLSFIPGTVGASPVQNIGAYGADISSIISSVRALDTTTMEFVELSNADCHFSYRHSRFKEERGRFIITKVTYALAKEGRVNIRYKDLKDYFAAHNDPSPSLAEVRQAVIRIRKDKLPDWKEWRTAGSFFKNPVISAEKFEELKARYPEMPGYPETKDRIKVSLGWILDKLCDAKGLTIGNVGTYEKQALVIVAKTGATAAEVVDFSNELMRRVKDKTGIEIESEVEWAVA